MTVQPFSIEKGIQIYLAPHLRRDGFSGSGRHFRRVKGGLINVINIQGSQAGGRFAINLGLQPLCIPDAIGNIPDPKTIIEALCEFRRRLSKTGADQWWSYDPSQVSVDQAMSEAAKMYVDIGHQLFEEQSHANSVLFSVTPDQFSAAQYHFSGFGNTKFGMARSLALMRKSAGNLEHARAFAQIALKNLRGASGFHLELEQLAFA